MKEDKQQDEKYILMTYRDKIQKKLPTTYYTSDNGWGCMLRVGQMAIANLLYRHQSIPFDSILKMFWDNSELPFSIQCFTKATVKLYPKKQQYEWYNPCEMGFIIKELLEEHFPYFNVKIFLDNSIFLSQIPLDRPKILMMIMIRIGLEEPEQRYLKTIKSLMSNRFFFAALGGTPKHAHLFVQIKDKMIGYLDPHKTSKAASTENQLLQNSNEYVSKLAWLKLNRIDSSMGLIYRVEKQEVEQFWITLQSIKQEHGQDFFIYMEKERPVYEEGDLIEINDVFQEL